MVEQALFFAIGFLVASLAALVAAPLVSRRAMRLAEMRARLLAPLTEKQASADRDALQAIHAVEQTRLERRLALAEQEANRLRAVVGAQTAKLISLGDAAAERESVIFNQQAEIAKNVVERRDLEVAVAAARVALQDAFAQRDRARVREGELEADVNRDRAKIAILTAQTESLRSRVEDLSRLAQTGEARAQKAISEFRKQAAEGEPARELERRLSEAVAQRQDMKESLAEARRRLREVEERLQLSEQAREEILIENARQLTMLANREAALKAAQDKVTALDARLAAISKDLHASDADSSPRARTLGSDQAAIEESLRAARADREALQRENEALLAKIADLAAPAHFSANDAELRSSIQRLGREVSRLFAARQLRDRGDPRDSDQSPAVSPTESADARTRGLGESPGRRDARSHATEG